MQKDYDKFPENSNKINEIYQLSQKLGHRSALDIKKIKNKYSNSKLHDKHQFMQKKIEKCIDYNKEPIPGNCCHSENSKNLSRRDQ